VFKRIFGMSASADKTTAKDIATVPAPPQASPSDVHAANAPANGVELLIDAFPGPAILFDDAMAPIRIGSALADIGPEFLKMDWGRALIAWLTSREGEAGANYHTATIMTDHGLVLIEWCATLLPGDYLLLLGRDVTLERHLRQALADSRQRFRDMVDMACDFSFETDADGQLIYVSSDGALGYPSDALVGAHFSVLLAVEGLERTPFEARRPIRAERLELLRIDGARVMGAVSARPLHDDQGAWTGSRGVVLLETAREALQSTISSDEADDDADNNEVAECLVSPEPSPDPEFALDEEHRPSKAKE
jgi:PAS domain S-box-containing protein